MKNFNFKIINFYSIFSQMPNQMPEENKNKINNFDSFLNNGIKLSLENKVSEGFTSEMVKRIALEKEFAIEDIKTSKIAKYIIGGFISLIAFFIISFSLFFSLNGENKDVSRFNNVLDRFSDAIESVSVLISENLGFTFDFQTAMIFIVLMVFIFLFSYSDKLLFKKGFK